jgi:hypothetical protein
MSLLLTEFIATHERIFVLTGAGVSTASGIPDYRDDSGDWKHQRPMDYREFVERHEARQRYWARSFIGWQRFRHARPNQAHLALARLEQLDRLTCRPASTRWQPRGYRVTRLAGLRGLPYLWRGYRARRHAATIVRTKPVAGRFVGAERTRW